MVVEINDAIIPFAFIWFVCSHFWSSLGLSIVIFLFFRNLTPSKTQSFNDNGSQEGKGYAHGSCLSLRFSVFGFSFLFFIYFYIFCVLVEK